MNICDLIHKNLPGEAERRKATGGQGDITRNANLGRQEAGEQIFLDTFHTQCDSGKDQARSGSSPSKAY